MVSFTDFFNRTPKPSSNQAQQQTQPDAPAGGNGTQQTDGDGVDFSRGSIWAPPKDQQQQNGNGNNPPPNQNNNGNNGNGGQNADPNAAFNAYIESLGLDVDVSAEALQKFRDSGDFAGMQEAFRKSQQKLYGQMLKDTGRLVQSAVEQAVEKAVGKMSQINSTNDVIRSMNSALPFTKDPNVAPIAQAVMSQMMKNNKGDIDKSIGHVKSFFQNVHKLSAKDLGLGDNGGGPGSGRYNNQSSGSEIDFVALLTEDQSAN